MTKHTVFTDPIGVKLIVESDPETKQTTYSALYPKPIVLENDEEEIGTEVLPFQVGPPSINGVNGVTNELLLFAVKHRIETQNAIVPSIYNELALLFLEQAIALLIDRDAERKLTNLTQTTKTTDELSTHDKNAIEVLRFNYLFDRIESFAKKYNVFVETAVKERQHLRPVSAQKLTLPALKQIFVSRKR